MTPRATLEVDLVALRSNYRLLKDRLKSADCAAVVKANAYGLGVEAVSRALHEEGCRDFFVATLDEGIELRRHLPDARIAVFSGLFAGEEKDYAAHRLTPVLNDPGQVERFTKSPVASRQSPVYLHVDTGMTRLGLTQAELQKILTNHEPRFTNHVLLMSHLACSSDPAHPKNAEQLARFKQALSLFSGVKASFANSAGIFLSPEYHFDLVRPGCALYGINPATGDNPMRHVATLSAPILQLRTLDGDETVGYGATQAAKKGSRIAIIALGYADGYFRSQGKRGHAFLSGHKVPIVGRVSMDMIALDVASVPDSALSTTSRAEFINASLDVNEVASQCGTIGYEVFTRIGRRVARVYR